MSGVPKQFASCAKTPQGRAKLQATGKMKPPKPTAGETHSQPLDSGSVGR